MRARFPNTSPRAVVAPAGTGRVTEGRVAPSAPRRALALLGATVVAGGLAACSGGGSPSAQSLVNETFTSHKPIGSGRIEMSFALSPVAAVGSVARTGPFSVRLTGPFQSLGAGQLPRFALQLSLTNTGHTLQAGATASGGRLFVELAGVPFVAPESTMRALQQGYTDATRTAAHAKGRSSLAWLGVAPGKWLTHPAIAGSGRVAGVEAVHIVAGLNVARFLSDAEKLSAAGGSLGLGGAAQGSGLFSPAQISALSSSVRSAQVDVYTGRHDHLLRRLSLRAALATTARARAALAGLPSATLSLELQFADLNRPMRIAPPSNPRPVSELLPALDRLGLAKGSHYSG